VKNVMVLESSLLCKNGGTNVFVHL